MKFCLGICFQNEESWLRQHLLKIPHPHGWGLVGLDGGSTDQSAALFEAEGGVVYHRPFDWHFGNHMNALIEACTASGYDAMLRLDPDETVFPYLFSVLEETLESVEIVGLPRYAFVEDREHWNPRWHPDYQLRAFRLNRGLRYQGTVHEMLNFTEGRYGLVYLDRARPHTHIYHYGWTLPLEQRRIREAHYAELRGGNFEPSEHLQDGYPYHEPFAGEQP